MFFTQEDYEKINQYLKLNAKKDSDFEQISDVLDNDTMVVLHQNKNKSISILDLKSRLTTDFDASWKAYLDDKLDDFQNQINGLLINGLAVSNKFGDNPYIGMSLLAITRAMVSLWQKFEDITGEVFMGINMTVNPDYFVSDNGCNVHVTASTIDANGIFDDIEFRINDEIVYKDECKDYVEFDTHIDDTVIIKCTATILGVPYTRLHIISKLDGIWIGGGTNYVNVFNLEHHVQVNSNCGCIRFAKNITLSTGLHIIVIIKKRIKDAFIRADINGIEIPMTESTVTIEGDEYSVFTSNSTYDAGTYNIDING